MTTMDSGLTDRQLEAARLAAEGLTAKEIGQVMGVSPRTVKQHLTVVRHKLGVEKKRHLYKALKERDLLD